MSLFKKKETNEDPVPCTGDAMQQDDALREETVPKAPSGRELSATGRLKEFPLQKNLSTDDTPTTQEKEDTDNPCRALPPLNEPGIEATTKQTSMGNEPEKPSPCGEVACKHARVRYALYEGDRVAVEGVQNITDTASVAEEALATEETTNPSVAYLGDSSLYTREPTNRDESATSESLAAPQASTGDGSSPQADTCSLRSQRGGPTQLVEGVPPVSPVSPARPAELALSPAPAPAFDAVADLSDAQLAAIHARVLRGETITF